MNNATGISITILLLAVCLVLISTFGWIFGIIVFIAGLVVINHIVNQKVKNDGITVVLNDYGMERKFHVWVDDSGKLTKVNHLDGGRVTPVPLNEIHPDVEKRILQVVEKVNW